MLPRLSLYRFIALPRRPLVPSVANWANGNGHVLVRYARSPSRRVACLKITYGEYTARCQCCTTFRNAPEGVLPKAHYDNKVRDLVLDRIIKQGLRTTF